MAVFAYKARDKSGTLVLGELEGASAALVKNALAGQGLFPVAVQPKGFKFSFGFFRRTARQKLLVSLTRQFAVMVTAGSPIERILSMLERQTRDEGLKEALGKIHKNVSSGMRLAEAFASHPQFFSPIYVSMLAVGESVGMLGKILNDMAGILQKEFRIQSKIKAAMLYPKLVVGALVFVTSMMLIFVIPVFANFYGHYGAELPMPTKILIGMSDFLTHYWYLGLLGIGLGVWGWKRFAVSPRGRVFVGWLKFKIPIFGNLNVMVANARFGHLLSGLYEAGIPLSHALDVVLDTVDNTLFAEDIRHLKHSLERGEFLSTGMKRARYFTPMMVETTSVGEQTGKLGSMLEYISSFYDEEIDDTLATLVTLIEPMLLFVIFGLVALLALAVYLPSWNLSRVVMPT